MSWIYRKDQDTVRRMYYLTLMDPKLKVKERFGGVLLEEKKDEWKEAFDETVSRAGKSESAGWRRCSIRMKKAADRRQGSFCPGGNQDTGP